MLFVVAILTLLQAQAPRTGVLQGVVTTQSTVNLPGAQITVTDSADRQVTQILSGEDGHFGVVGLQPGRYKVTASLASFQLWLRYPLGLRVSYSSSPSPSRSPSSSHQRMAA